MITQDSLGLACKLPQQDRQHRAVINYSRTYSQRRMPSCSERRGSAGYRNCFCVTAYTSQTSTTIDETVYALTQKMHIANLFQTLTLKQWRLRGAVVTRELVVAA